VSADPSAIAPAPDETLDDLTAGWRMFQRKHGHRHSTDDVLTGWYAAQTWPRPPAAILDLGAGIGGVGLLALWRAPEARLVAIEAQEISFALLARNVALNGLGARVTCIHGDLRAVRIPDSFDMVTGSPPYWDASWGVVPADPQKAHARFELRGDVCDYAAAARAAIRDDGRFVFCFPAVQRARAEAAAIDAGFALVRSRDVIPRAGAAPLFSLFCCAPREAWTGPHVVEPAHVVRDAAGVETPLHAAARATFGLPRARVRG
jgi:tRNA1(Val) A37 N6-methylase TrmN6